MGYMLDNRNRGDGNMGDSKNNTGTENSGNWNSGDRNSGNRNSGDWNSGNWNSGDWNSGDRNSGDWNSGNRNSGDWNSGNWNSGDWNSGDWNSGDWNSGNRNSGNWNSGDKHVGCFNTENANNAYYFNTLLSVEVWDNATKPSWLYDPSPTIWVADTNMTDQEKADNPEFHVAEGYLRKNDVAVEWQEAMMSATDEEIQQVRDLPNFDAGVFKEITGLDLSIKKPKTCAGQVVEIEGVKYELKELK